MENLDQKLEEALSFAQYQTTLNHQRRVLRDQFESDTVLAHSGGLFKITQEWIAGFNSNIKWHLDSRSNPVYVENPQELLDAAKAVYEKAITKYGEAYYKLRTQRSVKALTDL